MSPPLLPPQLAEKYLKFEGNINCSSSMLALTERFMMPALSGSVCVCVWGGGGEGVEPQLLNRLGWETSQ